MKHISLLTLTLGRRFLRRFAKFCKSKRGFLSSSTWNTKKNLPSADSQKYTLKVQHCQHRRLSSTQSWATSTCLPLSCHIFLGIMLTFSLHHFLWSFSTEILYVFIIAHLKCSANFSSLVTWLNKVPCTNHQSSSHILNSPPTSHLNPLAPKGDYSQYTVMLRKPKVD